jgi:hypothetical protein
MNCEHCGKEVYNTPADGYFHKREQDAIDCYKKRDIKRFRVLTPSGVIADGTWLRREDIPARIPDRFNNYFNTEDAEIIEQ